MSLHIRAVLHTYDIVLDDPLIDCQGLVVWLESQIGFCLAVQMFSDDHGSFNIFGVTADIYSSELLTWVRAIVPLGTHVVRLRVPSDFDDTEMTEAVAALAATLFERGQIVVVHNEAAVICDSRRDGSLKLRFAMPRRVA